MEYSYVLCFMLVNCAILFQHCTADEIREIMFKLLSNEHKMHSYEKRIDDLETQFKTSMEELTTKLSTGLNTITETLKQYEPSMGEIRKDIKDTISNTVTQMVKSQHVALNIAMKREKVAMLKTQTEIKGQMNLMNTAFNNSQRYYEERFTNQTARLQDEFQAQKERAEHFMTKVVNTSQVHVNQQTENFENAQGSFEDLFTNKTERLDNRFNKQTEKVDDLIETILSESKQLHQTVEAYTEYTKNSTQSLEDGLKETLKQMKNEIFKNLTNETSGLESRLSSIEGRMTSHHVGFSARLTRKLPSIKGGTVIVLNEEFYDGSSSYDSSTGIFRAPISGMYLFRFTVHFSSKAKFAAVCLSLSTSTCVSILNGVKPNQTSNNFYVTYLYAGTNVYLFTISGQISINEMPWRTTFSGVLIHI